MKTFVGALVCLLCAGGVAQAQMQMPRPIPDFCASPTITAVATGNWSSPSTWTPAQVPVAGDKVSIPSGISVTYDQVSDAAMNCVGVNGTLTFSTTANTRLTAGTIRIESVGTLQIGPEPDSNLAEIVIADQPLNTTTDPERYGTGLLIFGTVTIAGAPKTPTFTRLSAEPLAGATTLTLSEAPTGWQIGDRLVLPDTRQLSWGEENGYYVWQGEVLTVANISGSIVTLTAPLAYNHKGARNAAEVLQILPHIGNLTRNVRIRSANSSGTRGHVLATARANVDIRHAAFLGLGRTTLDPEDTTAFDGAGNVTHLATNQVGRYALHIHHLTGPTTPQANGHQFTLIGNVVEETSKWGLAVHDSHFGLIQDNVVYNTQGSAVVAEDGSETQNVFDHNFAVRGVGTGGRDARGREGVGFWFRGADNVVTNNVAANFHGDQMDARYGFKYFLYQLGTVRTPNAPGLDQMDDNNVTSQNGNAIKIRKFENNEAYGAMESGLTFWWIGFSDTHANLSTPESVIKNFTAWHVFNRGIYHYEAYNLTVDGLKVLGSFYEWGGNGVCCQIGVDFGDYYGHTITYKNFDIQDRLSGFIGSILADGSTTTIQDGYLNNQLGISIGLMTNVAQSAEILKDRHYVLRNVTIVQGPQTAYLLPMGKIVLGYDDNPAITHNFIKQDRIDVYDFNGNPNDDFRIYYTQQDPSYSPVPVTSELNFEGGHKHIGAPVAGLTNAQTWASYGIAIAGALATCTTTRVEVSNGYACALTPPAPTATFADSFGSSTDVAVLSAAWNDRISSVHVPAGYKVILYELENYGGLSLELNSDADLGNYPGPGPDGTWKHVASSLKLVALP